MDTTKLKKFAQFARRALIEQVAAKLEAVCAEGSAAQREHPAAFKKLEASIAQHGEEEVVERVAYIWFNRFTALRFLDVNELNSVRVVSPLPGQFQPEILADAKAGNINEQLVPEATRRKVRDLLEGLTPSHDPQAEAYRLLLVAICNSWQTSMPFLFERIDDYTELLLPADLLSNASILAYLREAMTPDACQDVEIIGWLYQFYISEKKDQVFAALKKNKKIEAENIPAATQLFTPHWIVRYLVENSLGRLWLLNRPGSKLVERMDYYIAPEEPETGFLKITKPEEIRICDPACGSGHMLTYAFDLLYAIYEEEGYDAAGIPALILQHNLTGVEIDDRAGALAAFALAMKAAARLGRRRFLRMEAKPGICVLQNVAFTASEMQDVAAVVGKDLFTDELRETLGQFSQAKNFGSLIVPKLRDPAETLQVVKARDFGGDLLLKEVQERVVVVLRMAEALSPKYHVVVANPPYMGANNANTQLKSWLGTNYGNSKRDLFSAFVERNLLMCRASGAVAMITMQNWMFISRFQAFRDMIFARSHISTMAHLGERAFDSIGGEVVSTTAFVLVASKNSSYRATFVRLTDGTSEAEKLGALTKAASDTSSSLRYSASEADFKKIPGDPLAYWVSAELRDLFASAPDFDSILEAREGLTTGKNEDYVRYSYEVSADGVCRNARSREAAIASGAKWFPYNKGGEKRKWFGNDEFVVNWADDGEQLQTRKHPSGDRIWAHNFNLDFIFRPSISWSAITTKGLSARLFPDGFIFDATGLSAFNRTDEDCRWLTASICNSHVGTFVAYILNPTMHFKAGDFAEFPLINSDQARAEEIAKIAVGLARRDWNACETSWDFTSLPLLSPDHRAGTLVATYARLRAHWHSMTDEMQRLEEENNRIFIDGYGLQDELTPEVPLNEITLTCNPAHRYGVKGSEESRETRLRADTMAEFMSYAVGCMFGRYSLDAPGVILANQGERLEDYLARIPEPTFTPDADNVIPVLDENWFADDITERFRLFLRVTFGEAHFRENLRYIEDSLGKDIRKYFTKDFYADHVKRYKKRPIYWMFSSPKGTFNALIYMHRYRGDTVSVLLNDYLREFISKLEGKRGRLEKLSDDPSANQGQRSKALKDMAVIAKQIDELNEWERDVVFPLAQAKIEIDLDDGVKANYPKFGEALKKIAGLEASDD
jgi:hypothetical protein